MSVLVQAWLDVSNAWFHGMVEWSWQALLLVSLVFLCVKVDRRCSPATRHQLWLLGLIGIAVLPLWNVAAGFLPFERPSMKPLAQLSQLPDTASEMVAEQVAASGDSSLVPGSAEISGTAIAMGFLFMVWAGGVLACGVRLWRSYWKFRRLCRSAQPVAAGSALPVGYSAEVRTPVLAGLVHPMILFPVDLDAWTTEEQRRAFLLHELAHFERRDHVVNAFQSLLGVMFFFHPAIRYAIRQLSLEREIACDERVLAAGADRDSYSLAILRVAEHGIEHSSHQVAFGSSRKILERRIDMILSSSRIAQRARHSMILIKVALTLGVMTWVLLPQHKLDAALLEVAVTPPAGAQTQPEQFVTKAVVAAPRVVKPPPRPVAVRVQPQSQPGSVSGTVTDATGARIPGVTVKLSGGQTQVSTVTNDTGTYQFLQVAAGGYLIEASLPGFQAASINILLQAGIREVRNFVLQVVPVSTQVSVSVQRPQNVTAAQSVASPPAARTPLRIGGNIAQAALLFHPEPVYPNTAWAAGIEGSVALQAVIGKEGTVLALRVAALTLRGGNDSDGAGSSALATAALDAVKQWRYKPTLLNGMPVEVETMITVEFKLGN